jgi:hypothetical protein
MNLSNVKTVYYVMPETDVSTDYFAPCEKCLRQALIHSKNGEKLSDSNHLHPDPNTDDKSVARSSYGGDKVGMVVTFTVPEHLLDHDAYIIDGYGEVMTIGDLIAKRGAGKKDDDVF